MTDKLKILVCGDVEGKFKTLFTRVENINKKSGPFDFLLCVGNFFGHEGDNWELYCNGSLRVPLPVYILGPNGEECLKYYPDITGGELCTNVSYVGKRGVFTGLSGLKMAYVSGKPGSEETEKDCTFTKNDVIAVRDICLRSSSNFKGVDILATSGWPQNVMNLDLRQGLRHPNGSPLLSWLASEIKPRYHFCAQEGIFYERRPYRNYSNLGDTSHATRFIALAKVGNPQKNKWIYALSIDPIDRMKSNVLYQQTTDETESPYGKEMLLQIVRPQPEVKQSQFFYDMDNTSDDFSRRKRHKRDEEFKPKRRPPPVFDQALCWFCLASPEVEKHLIVSVGSEAYLAVAKGALVPDHVLILPIGHHQSLSCVPDDILKEIEQFKSALSKYYRQKGKVPVIFERNYKTSHLQIQVVPVPSKLVPRLKNEFQEKAEAEGFHLDELPEYAKLNQIAPAGTPYFYVELPGGDKLFHRIQKSFPLQFGRDVLASEYILNMPDRSDWKDCKVSREEETTMTNNFRSSFEEFDFTL